jgi:hypothetical protein
LAGGFSAGSAFVSILPSLGSFKSKLRTELARVNETVQVKVKADTSGLRTDIRSAVSALSGGEVKVKVKADTAGLRAEIETALAGLTGLSIDVTINIDLDGVVAAAAALAALQGQLDALGRGATDVRVRLNSTSFLTELARIHTELNTLAGGNIQINADTRQLMEQLAAARVELARLAAMDPSVQVDADTAAARAQIDLLERKLAEIAGRQYRAKVKVDDGDITPRMLAIGAAALYAIPALGSLTSTVGSPVGSLR